MSKSVDQFEKDLERLIDYYVSEFDLNFSEAIGTLEIQKQILINSVLGVEGKE